MILFCLENQLKLPIIATIGPAFCLHAIFLFKPFLKGTVQLFPDLSTIYDVLIAFWVL